MYLRDFILQTIRKNAESGYVFLYWVHLESHRNWQSLVQPVFGLNLNMQLVYWNFRSLLL